MRPVPSRASGRFAVGLDCHRGVSPYTAGSFRANACGTGRAVPKVRNVNSTARPSCLRIGRCSCTHLVIHASGLRSLGNRSGHIKAFWTPTGGYVAFTRSVDLAESNESENERDYRWFGPLGARIPSRNLDPANYWHRPARSRPNPVASRRSGPPCGFTVSLLVTAHPM